MTTLVGIVARKGKPGVVLASDIMGTMNLVEDRGDVSVRRQVQDPVTKISLNNDKTFALAIAGTYDDKFREFSHDLRHGKINFADAAKRGYLEEFLKLNLSRTDGKLMRDTTSLLVAGRFTDVPELYSCWPLGRVDTVPFYTSIGSGSGFALGYLGHELGNKVPREISIQDAINHAQGSVRHAGRDIHTKGLDISVVTSDGIKQYGDRIDNAAGKAIARELRNIIREYKP